MKNQILGASFGALFISILSLQASEDSGECVLFRDSLERQCRVSCEFDWQEDLKAYASEGTKLRPDEDCTTVRRWKTECYWDQLVCTDSSGSSMIFNYWYTNESTRQPSDVMKKAQCQYRPGLKRGECVLDCDTNFDPNCNAFQRKRRKLADPSKCVVPIGWETTCNNKGCLDESGKFIPMDLRSKRVNLICLGVNCSCVPD